MRPASRASPAHAFVRRRQAATPATATAATIRQASSAPPLRPPAVPDPVREATTAFTGPGPEPPPEAPVPPDAPVPPGPPLLPVGGVEASLRRCVLPRAGAVA